MITLLRRLGQWLWDHPRLLTVAVGLLAGDRAVVGDLRDAVDAFIDPLDPGLLALQELAAQP